MKGSNMQIENIIRGLVKGLLKWYEFEKNCRVLYVTGGSEKYEPLVETLLERDLEVERLSLSVLDQCLENHKKCIDVAYDYIVLVGALERSRYPEDVLQFLKDMLKPSGKLLVGADNRLGLRYFCGEKDPFTLRVYDGIEDYAKVGKHPLDICTAPAPPPTQCNHILH